MTDTRSQKPLTHSERDGLRGCSAFPEGYYWRPKTMEKLEARGLVEKRMGRGCAFAPGYFLTAAGRTALSESQP